MSKTYIIGDIHGCIDELQELMQLLSPDSGDRIIFIGDLIDRGPDSIGVVRQVVEWSKSLLVTLIIGNHEEKFIRYVHHVHEKTGKEKQMKGTEEFPALINALNDDELRFLKESFYSFHLPEFNALLVHGGVWKDVHFTLPSTYPYISDKTDLNKHLSLLTKTRYLNAQGKFISLGEEKLGDPFWAEVYQGQWGHIFFGHQVFLQSTPFQFSYATGIDTGCVFGGWLSAVEISSGEVKITSVAARKVYSYKK